MFHPGYGPSIFLIIIIIFFFLFIYFFLLGRGSDYVRVLKPDGQEILVMALSSLEDAVRTMKDGTIQYQLLMLISDNLDRFLELSQEIIKEGTTDAELRQNLDQRLVELSAFEVERDQVVGLIEMCNLIKRGNCFITWLRVTPPLFYKIYDILVPVAQKMVI